MKKIFFIIFIFLFNCGFKNILNDYKESFGYINSYYQLKPMFSILNNKEFLGINIELINELLKEYKILKASSHIIKHNNNETILITSNHVCEDLFDEFKFIDLETTLKENLINSNLISSDMLNLYTFTIENYVTDFYGNSHKLISKNKINIKNDLCEIRSKNTWGKKIQIEQTECNWGDEILNISVSSGYYFPNAVPIRSGFFLGETLNPISNEDNVNVYTIKIHQGASGSIVFNKQGKVCGNINFTSKESDISFGASNKQLLEFINSID